MKPQKFIIEFLFMIYKLEDNKQTQTFWVNRSSSVESLPHIKNKKNLVNSIKQGHNLDQLKLQSLFPHKLKSFDGFKKSKQASSLIPEQHEQFEQLSRTQKPTIKKYQSEQKIKYQQFKLNFDSKNQIANKIKKKGGQSLQTKIKLLLDNRKFSQSYNTIDLWKLRHHSDKLELFRPKKNINKSIKKQSNNHIIQPLEVDQQQRINFIKNMSSMRNLIVNRKNNSSKKNQVGELNLNNGPKITKKQIKMIQPKQVQIQKAYFQKQSKKKIRMTQLREINSRQLIDDFPKQQINLKQKRGNKKKQSDLQKIKKQLKLLQIQSSVDQYPSKWNTNNFDYQMIEAYQMNWASNQSNDQQNGVYIQQNKEVSQQISQKK